MVIDKPEILVNGYNPETSTAYQFYGRKWHRCLCLKATSDEVERRYHETINLENRIPSLGYNIILV